MTATSFYDFTLKTIDGEDRSLGDYRGNVVLVVNVASKCGLTPHYKGLQELYEQHAGDGLTVLGLPCNQFGSQEPGSEADIKEFCSTNYGVTFPMFSKIEVNGDGRAPLYAWLTAEATQPEGPGDIQWNFTKFLVGKHGQVVARFAPPAEPESNEIRNAVAEALAE